MRCMRNTTKLKYYTVYKRHTKDIARFISSGTWTLDPGIYVKPLHLTSRSH